MRPPSTDRPAGLTRLALACGLLGLAPGCGLVPRSRVDDCRNRVLALQAENKDMRDVVVNVRAENKDMAQRAVDDSRRLRVQEQAIARYEREIATYQDEREQMLALLDQIRGQVRTAASDPPTTSMIQSLDSFSRSHPGASLDPREGVVTIPADLLFAPGSAKLTAEGESLLGDLSARLGGPEAGTLGLSIAAGSDDRDDGVRLASGSDEPDNRANLGLDRARLIRDRLAADAGLDPTWIAVSSLGRTPLDRQAVHPAAAPDTPAVAIRVRQVRPEG